ncbi:hypothetical protein [Escherichia coli]|uniref:hypothetical protein n=1 Tax=Escherichia coli TaxID=562 RepID=UPI003D9F3169
MGAYGCELKEITQYCDSFTICLSKGLGRQSVHYSSVSVITGKRAIRWRKMAGWRDASVRDSGCRRDVCPEK